MSRSLNLARFLSISLICASSSLRAATGMLLYPIVQHGVLVAKVGEVVEYLDESGYRMKVRIHGKDVDGAFGVIPLDPDFAPFRIYVELVSNVPVESPAQIKDLQDRVDLADAALRLFPRSPLREDIEAQDVRLTRRLVNCQTEQKTPVPDPVSKARRYIVDFPQGKYRDEFEWDIVLWSNEVYETEGDAGIPLRQARAYERFAAAHPGSSYLEEIKDYEANAYRMAGDLLDYGPDSKKPGPGKPYRAKAEAIYVSLAASKDPTRRAQIRVALYNLRHGRVPGFATPTSPPVDW